MNDVSNREEPAVVAAEVATAPPGRQRLRPLMALVPYVMRYRGQVTAAVVALLVASAATLIVPLAVRRMIDFGFSAERIGLIDRAFAVLLRRREERRDHLAPHGRYHADQERGRLIGFGRAAQSGAVLRLGR